MITMKDPIYFVQLYSRKKRKQNQNQTIFINILSLKRVHTKNSIDYWQHNLLKQTTYIAG